tara:strand:- start:1458 stop:1916 length:459 start_codon:yes stop_codon:yes gene_type:complete
MPSNWGKILGILLYMIPWSDSLIFGNHLYIKYPLLQIIQIPAIPIILIERSIPFGSLILFLSIFIGLIRNQKVSYFVRLNALQSLLLNIGIIIISYLFEIFLSPFKNALIIRTFSSTLLISIFSIITYCVWSCAKGNKPNLPLISNAAKMQL